MKEKLKALVKNETWTLTSLPMDVKPITCKWVYKVWKKTDGAINKFKPRLLKKGFLEVYGLD